MSDTRMAFLIETDESAVSQMQRVLSVMQVSSVVASDRDSALRLASDLAQRGSPPQLIVTRVTTANGSGLEILDEVAKVFPDAAQVLVSHYPQRLLLNVPGFYRHRGSFLQEAFTDEQFERVVRRAFSKEARG